MALSLSVPAFADEAEVPVTQEVATETETHTPNLGVSQEVHERNRIRKAEHKARKLAEKRERMEKKAERKAAKAQLKANRRQK
ncbi:MAG: hypothetical protein A2X94_17040 [Bdellovibrionales bacterium GWB1_55_8]|nr:MAG: hypothetical protein A2X94_17040 [Bdellovibrionales bacterium GWB1_55_8]